MGNNWKITDTLTKVFAEEVPDGQGSIRLSTLHRETVSCVIAYFGAADWGRYWKVSVKAPEKIETRLRRVELPSISASSSFSPSSPRMTLSCSRR